MKLLLEYLKLNYVTPDERIRDFHSQFICDNSLVVSQARPFFLTHAVGEGLARETNSLGTFEIVMEKVYSLLCCMCTAHCIYLLCTFFHCTRSYVHTVN